MDTRRPAKLLSRFSRYPNHALWGFALDHGHILAEFNKILPPNLSEADHMNLLRAHCKKYFSGLAKQCRGIWYSPTTGIEPVCSKNGEQWIMAIIKCTRPDDNFLPPADKIEEMKKVVRALGFTEEPNWYTAMDIG